MEYLKCDKQGFDKMIVWQALGLVPYLKDMGHHVTCEHKSDIFDKKIKLDMICGTQAGC